MIPHSAQSDCDRRTSLSTRGRGRRSIAAHLHESRNAVPVAIAGAGFDAAARASTSRDLAVGADRQVRATRLVTVEGVAEAGATLE